MTAATPASDAKPGLLAIQVRHGNPDFLDLPWELPLAQWEGRCTRLVRVERGLSRHEVVFVAYDQGIYACKELPTRLAEREYEILRELEDDELPCVQPVGHVHVRRVQEGEADEASVLITRYLDSSLPYRTLFMNRGLERYRERLLDAMTSLLVRLHLGGFYWGDCSLSNTLFRRDAGELRAYVVDAETSELHETLSSGQRKQDLMIMEENVAGELADLSAIVELPAQLDVYTTGASIIARYERLWAELAREIPMAPGEGYKIQERIRALNDLGFSVGEFELVAAGDGKQLRLRTIVTDRDYHRHQLHSLTGIVAEARQAALMLNEIQEMRATLSSAQAHPVSLNVAAFRWGAERYQPTTLRLQPRAKRPDDLPELYCQVLEHKWFLSESAKRDVGLEASLESYLQRAEAAEPKPDPSKEGASGS